MQDIENSLFLCEKWLTLINCFSLCLDIFCGIFLSSFLIQISPPLQLNCMLSSLLSFTEHFWTIHIFHPTQLLLVWDQWAESKPRGESKKAASCLKLSSSTKTFGSWLDYARPDFCTPIETVQLYKMIHNIWKERNCVQKGGNLPKKNWWWKYAG